MKTSGWHLAPTADQLATITRLAAELNYSEPVEKAPVTRRDAQNMIAGFRLEKKKRREQ